MKKVMGIFLALLLGCAGAFAEANGGEVTTDDGSNISYSTDEQGNTSLTMTNQDGSASGRYYDSATDSYTEWEMDAQGNTYSTTTNADGSQTGYSSIAGESFTDWNSDTDGNTFSTTYNTDGTTSGSYLSGSGSDYTEWQVDKKGNTSGTVYNYITGETTTFYDPAVGTTSNSSSTRKTTSQTSSSSVSSYSAAPVSYPAVSSASGPAYIFSSVGAVNVYTYPSADATVIARLESGTPVNVISTVGGWSEIAYGNTTGHVDARFISFTAPAVAATPIPTVIPAVPYTPTVKTATEQYVTMIKIQPVTVTVRVPQAGAAVILRWAPSETEPAISNLAEGYSLTALSMNTEWVQVYDPKTNDVGFIPRAFVNGL